MAKSATVVRDDKQGAQPVNAADKANKLANKAADKVTRQPGVGVGGENAVVGLFTRSADFLKDVRGEMRKVVTPSKEEVRNTTTIVIVTVFGFAAFFYVVDGALGWFVRTLLHSLGGAR
jgi:preprotein translocase subunit SecE